MIDNQSIYKSTINSLRKNISLVSQDTTLFDDTIKNNIAYANLNANQEEIEEAAKYSYANEFIDKLPSKYDTIIGENGVRLSGGEKQRLSIARAILKKSPIILLDEATSSLDAESFPAFANASRTSKLILGFSFMYCRFRNFNLPVSKTAGFLLTRANRNSVSYRAGSTMITGCSGNQDHLSI